LIDGFDIEGLVDPDEDRARRDAPKCSDRIAARPRLHDCQRRNAIVAAPPAQPPQDLVSEIRLRDFEQDELKPSPQDQHTSEVCQLLFILGPEIERCFELIHSVRP
jgi:hypothetical protein